MIITLTAFVTGADRGLGYSLCEVLLEQDVCVFAGRFMPGWTELDALRETYPERLHIVELDVSDMASVREAVQFTEKRASQVDLLINNAGIAGTTGSLGEEMDYGKANRLFNVNSLGPLRMTEMFLPLMRNGMKRLCFISSEAGSVSVCSRVEMFAYTMSKTALNMAIRHMHNQLHAEGFTFRVYHPGWLRSYMSGKKNENATVEPRDSAVSAVEQFLKDTRCESALQMLDNTGAVWPF